MKKKIYLSLGSNVGDRAANLRQGIERLACVGAVTAVSSLYETEPVEVEGPQPWFLNCAVALESDLMPRQFLARILAVEHELGRRRTGVRTPRTLDIDILLIGNAVIETPELTVPHPGMHQRRFVLAPLAEIAPELRHPVLKATVREMLDELPVGTGLVRKVRKG